MWYIDALLAPQLITEWVVTAEHLESKKYAGKELGVWADLYMLCVVCGSQLSVCLPPGKYTGTSG